MAATATRTKLRSSTRVHRNGVRRSYASNVNRARGYLEGMTNRVRSGYRSTRNMIRRHPGTSSAILAIGISAVAGVLVGVALRSRFKTRWPLVSSPESLADFLASWHR
jgi:hypothetical protein